jgi:hypothetical protein
MPYVLCNIQQQKKYLLALKTWGFGGYAEMLQKGVRFSGKIKDLLFPKLVIINC